MAGKKLRRDRVPIMLDIGVGVHRVGWLAVVLCCWLSCVVYGMSSSKYDRMENNMMLNDHGFLCVLVVTFSSLNIL